MDFPPISEEKKIELIKRAILSQEGWRAIALSVGNSPDAKTRCIEALKKIAGDREVPVAIDASSNPCNNVKFADLLIQQLEYNLALVEATKEEK